MKRSVSILFGLVLILGLVWGVMAGRETAVASGSEQAVAPEGQWVTRITGPMGLRQRISMSSENDGWFMQFSANSTAYLAQYDGFNWNVFGSVGHSQTIINGDVKMVSANDGWLVLGGEIGATDATSSIYRWDGTNWNFITPITDPNAVSLSSLEVLAANDVWALGGGKFWSNLYHWDGTVWSFAGKTPGGVWADNDLSMLSANNGWAVGFKGSIAHWDGFVWTESVSSTSSTLNAIDMVDSNTGWAVGDDGAIQAWGGTAWATYPSPTSVDLHNIDMISADEGWIIGDGVILYWDGSQWSQYTPPLSDQFHAIDMVSVKNGWIVGNGSILQYKVTEPELLMHYTTGAPGSYLSVAGQNFPANETATITVNGRMMGTTAVDGNGRFLFILTTTNADEGEYYITASVNPSATKKFTLNAADPVRPQEDTGDTFEIPAEIAFDEFVFLPAIVR